MRLLKSWGGNQRIRIQTRSFGLQLCSPHHYSRLLLWKNKPVQSPQHHEPSQHPSHPAFTGGVTQPKPESPLLSLTLSWKWPARARQGQPPTQTASPSRSGVLPGWHSDFQLDAISCPSRRQKAGGRKQAGPSGEQAVRG